MNAVSVIGVGQTPVREHWDKSLRELAVEAGLAMAADADYEAANGISFVALNALLMRRYMYEYDLVEEDFAAFSINAHQNALNNPNAMFHRAITLDDFRRAKMVSDPINVLDSSPICDGAAAVILSRHENLNGSGARAVEIAASSVATDSLALHDRNDPLWLSAVELS